MKITKRKLNSIVKEEIMEALQGLMGEQELEEMGHMPFDGHGYVGESPVEDKEAAAESVNYQVLEAELRSVLADQSLDPALRRQKIKELSMQLTDI
tara:strand:+ start:113 stop:400 length:288 start_codon:yes stop_codon:yes gene_type:complete